MIQELIQNLTTITPINLYDNALSLSILVGLGLVTLFAAVTVMNVRLLNRTVQTNLATPIFLVSLLFLAATVGTLFLAFSQWIKPLI